MHGRRTERVWDASERFVPQPIPTLMHKTPLDVLAGYCSLCSRVRHRRLPFIRRLSAAATAAAADMDLGVLDP